MPFCSQCGNQVGTTDLYCGRCGTAQPPAGSQPGGPGPTPRPFANDPLSSFDGRTASILCYVPWLGWIMSIIVLASDRFRGDRTVRFHGFQSLYLFVAWLMENEVLRPLFRHAGGFPLHGLIQAVLFDAAIFMMVKAAHREAYSLPLFGDLAKKSMADN